MEGMRATNAELKGELEGSKTKNMESEKENEGKEKKRKEAERQQNEKIKSLMNELLITRMNTMNNDQKNEKEKKELCERARETEKVLEKMKFENTKTERRIQEMATEGEKMGEENRKLTAQVLTLSGEKRKEKERRRGKEKEAMQLGKEVEHLSHELIAAMEETERNVIENMELRNDLDVLIEEVKSCEGREQWMMQQAWKMRMGWEETAKERDDAVFKLNELAKFDERTLDVFYKEGEFRMEVKEGSRTVRAMAADAKKTMDEMKEVRLHVELGMSKEEMKSKVKRGEKARATADAGMEMDGRGVKRIGEE